MKNYNLYDVRAQLKNEDAKGYLTLKNVMPTQDADYYEKYPITVDALHIENGTEMKVYLVGDEAWLDELIANKGQFVDSHEVEYFNVDRKVQSVLRPCKVRIL
jgi:hypothetical protein